MATTGYQSMTEDVPTPLLKWSAVFGGLVLGLATLLLLTALWLALAYGSDLTDVSSNLEWYIGLSAIASLFIAGSSRGTCPVSTAPGRACSTASRCGGS